MFVAVCLTICRFVHASRYPMALVGQVLLPALFALAAMLIATNSNLTSNLPPRAFCPACTYGSNTALRSARDLGGDTWSVVTNSTQSIYGVLGSMPVTAARTALNAKTGTFLSTDPRSNVATVDKTDLNLTKQILQACTGFQTNNFFRKYYYSFSYESSWFDVRTAASGGGCEILGNDGTWAARNLTLKSGGFYVLRGAVNYTAVNSSSMIEFLDMSFFSDLGITPINRVTTRSFMNMNSVYTIDLTNIINGTIIYMTCGAQTYFSTITAQDAVGSFDATGITGYAWYSPKVCNSLRVPCAAYELCAFF
jgi:hypothetical protein